jgi:hypothetical protein
VGAGVGKHPFCVLVGSYLNVLVDLDADGFQGQSTGLQQPAPIASTIDCMMQCTTHAEETSSASRDVAELERNVQAGYHYTGMQD